MVYDVWCVDDSEVCGKKIPSPLTPTNHTERRRKSRGLAWNHFCVKVLLNKCIIFVVHFCKIIHILYHSFLLILLMPSSNLCLTIDNDLLKTQWRLKLFIIDHSICSCSSCISAAQLSFSLDRCSAKCIINSTADAFTKKETVKGANSLILLGFSVSNYLDDKCEGGGGGGRITREEFGY